MRFNGLIALCAATALAAGAGAQEITGTVLIKKKLTKPSVTAAVSVYQRGAAVKLGKDSESDPIAYELSRVVIYLEGPGLASGDAASRNPEGPIAQVQQPQVQQPQVQQLDRRFVPDLVVVPVGSTVSFPNMDPIFHNIYSLSKPKTFDLGSYDRGETRKVLFSKPGMVEVYCHLHPNMAATIVVAPNRWYAQPGRDGQYSISNVPPGRYTVVAWHKSAGFFRRTINVVSGHGATADFFIPVEADSKRQETRAGALSEGEGASR